PERGGPDGLQHPGGDEHDPRHDEPFRVSLVVVRVLLPRPRDLHRPPAPRLAADAVQRVCRPQRRVRGAWQTRRVTSSDRAVPARYVLATAGACKGTPGPAGGAWVGEAGPWAAGSLPQGTNNLGQLLGLLHAIRDHLNVRELIVQADSKYAIDTYSSWMDG